MPALLSVCRQRSGATALQATYLHVCMQIASPEKKQAAELFLEGAFCLSAHVFFFF